MVDGGNLFDWMNTPARNELLGGNHILIWVPGDA
jgi:hypothetical protein